MALFRADSRPGARFGRRRPLYDDLGNPTPLEHADTHLTKDVEAAKYGLPPLRAGAPGADGAVWF